MTRDRLVIAMECSTRWKMITVNGFRYLEAVRDVFSHRDNISDYRTPQMLGLGPYDQKWLELMDR